jgi:Actinobacteria/chloroflexi VLRF1 release factor
VSNGSAGETRWIDVTPERLAGWLDSFADRHGDVTGEAGPDVVTFRAADGAVAECHVPFPPLPRGGGPGPDGAGQVAAWAGRISEHARAERTVGVLLVRLGGYAAGVFTGPSAHLAASKVGSRLVHGRSAAGGQSQQRFARRREKQAGEALGAAADVAVAVFAPYADRLDAVVLGGDRRAIAGLRDDPRLRPYFKLAVERFLTVPDPRLAVLRAAPRQFRAIRIRLTEPPEPEGRAEGRGRTGEN